MEAWTDGGMKPISCLAVRVNGWKGGTALQTQGNAAKAHHDTNSPINYFYHQHGLLMNPKRGGLYHSFHVALNSILPSNALSALIATVQSVVHSLQCVSCHRQPWTVRQYPVFPHTLLCTCGSLSLDVKEASPVQ